MACAGPARPWKSTDHAIDVVPRLLVSPFAQYSGPSQRPAVRAAETGPRRYSGGEASSSEIPGGNAEVTPGPATRTRSTDVAAASGEPTSAMTVARATNDPLNIVDQGSTVAGDRTPPRSPFRTRRTGKTRESRQRVARVATRKEAEWLTSTSGRTEAMNGPVPI